MSIWAKLFRRATSPRPLTAAAQAGSEIERWQSAARAMLANQTNWRLVRASLERLEAAGLRIIPTLDRDLIVVRFLCGWADYRDANDLATFCADAEGGRERNTLDLAVFLELASETDAFFNLDEIDAILPQLSTMSDETLNEITYEHSLPIFENAKAICIVNEHGPGYYVPQKVHEFEALAFDDFTIQSVTEKTDSGLLFGQITLSDGRSVSFDIRHEKRPDITPFFKAMNSLIAHLDKGRFIAVLSGNSEEIIVVYLRPNEQLAFRHWAEQQHYADGSIPVDWIV